MSLHALNFDIFKEYFSSGELDFSSWLQLYLEKNATFPFVLGGPLDADLNELLRELVRESKGEDYNKIDSGVRQCFLRSSERFDLEGVKTIAHAIAYSGMNSNAQAVAIAIDTITYKLASVLLTKSERVSAYLAVDQMFASLSTLALSGDKTSLRVSEMCLREPKLSPFSAILFAPVAVQKIVNWPQVWEVLLKQAMTPSELFAKSPNEANAIPELSLRSAHFNALSTLEDFFSLAVRQSHSFKELVAATNGYAAERARIAIALLESRGRIRRSQINDELDKISPAFCLEGNSSHRLTPDLCIAEVVPPFIQSWPNTRARIHRASQDWRSTVLTAFSEETELALEEM